VRILVISGQFWDSTCGACVCDANTETVLWRQSRSAASSGGAKSVATAPPAQTRTFDNKTIAQQWARSPETELDSGIGIDRRPAERTTRAEILEHYRRDVTPAKRGADAVHPPDCGGSCGPARLNQCQ